MPFSVEISYEFYLKSEVESKIDHIFVDEDTSYSILSFVVDYIHFVDEKSTKEYLIDNKIINKLVAKELESMGVSHEYKNKNEYDAFDMCISTKYVTDRKVSKLTKYEMEKCKMTEIILMIEKRKRKRGSSIKSARNEPPCKKSKLTE